MEPTALPSTDSRTHPVDDPSAGLPADRVRIVSTPGVCGGRPRIDGHRIQVEDVAIWHERMGMSPDEIASEFFSITLADVHAAPAIQSRKPGADRLRHRGRGAMRGGDAIA